MRCQRIALDARSIILQPMNAPLERIAHSGRAGGVARQSEYAMRLVCLIRETYFTCYWDVTPPGRLAVLAALSSGTPPA